VADTARAFEEHGEAMWINMGPQHPMTHGLWNLRVKVDGETVVDAQPEIGYLHRGVEKIAEVREFHKVVVLTDRLCYVSSVTWSHAYCLAVEELQGIVDKLPPRARYLRVISNELQRVASHLMWLAAYGPDLGLLTGLLWALRERELFLDLLQALTGQRMNQNYPRIGGVRNDMPATFPRDCEKVIRHFRKKLTEYDDLFETNRTFRMRTDGVGVLSRADAYAWGVTGPNLRASGAPVDLRKLDPYDAYPDLAFEPAVERSGDCLGRYLVRMREMRTSCDLILEALKKIPAGPYRLKPPRRAEGTAFRRTEDSRGEALFYVAGDGSDRPYRVKIRSPIFCTMSAVPTIMRGEKVADVISIMGSLDVCVGEMDK
jgi:NADH-quinone oxidoreductase subunit D